MSLSCDARARHVNFADTLPSSSLNISLPFFPPVDNVDYMDYNNQLRHGIVDAYSGIIQGLGPQKCMQYLRNETPAVLEFVSSIGSEVGALSMQLPRCVRGCMQHSPGRCEMRWLDAVKGHSDGLRSA